AILGKTMSSPFCGTWALCQLRESDQFGESIGAVVVLVLTAPPVQMAVTNSSRLSSGSSSSTLRVGRRAGRGRAGRDDFREKNRDSDEGANMGQLLNGREPGGARRGPH